MAWLQIHVTTGRDGAPKVERLLEGLGALSVTLEDAADEALLEPNPGESPVWRETIVTGLFDGNADSGSLRAAILASAGAETVRALETGTLEDRVWERAWMDDFHPMRFGDHLWICPTGQSAPDQGATTIELDPGLAFGTGTHPTTRLCLEWLAGLKLAEKHVLDLGCGSGVLAIAALRLGARHVTAVDHDPQALQATKDNAEKNGVLDRLTIHQGADADEQRVDVLVANILAGTLVELEPLIADCLRPGGLIALSGILKDQEKTVSDGFSAHFHIEGARQDGEWVLLSGRRR